MKNKTNPSGKGSSKTHRRRRQRIKQASATKTTKKGTRWRHRRQQRNRRRKMEHYKRRQQQHLKRILARLQANAKDKREVNLPTNGVCGWEYLHQWKQTPSAAMVVPRMKDSIINTRTPEDGLLLVVQGRVNGRDVAVMIDSGATRNFIAPQAVERLQLSTEEELSTLELADGSKFISEGKVPNILLTLRSCTFKAQATVAKLFKGLDLILGMTWLEQVNPFINWTAKKLFIQQNDDGSWVQGHWCPELMEAKIKVNSGQSINLNEKIAILKRPTLWNIASNKLSWRKVPQGGSSSTKFMRCVKENGKIKKKVCFNEQAEYIDENGQKEIKNIKEKKTNDKKEKRIDKKMNRNPTQIKSTQLVEAKRMGKIIKDGEQAFLCMIRPQERTSGTTEAAKRDQIKARGPKKEFAKVTDVIRQAVDQVPIEAKDQLKNLLKEYKDVFPDKLPAGQPPKRHIEHAIPIKEGESPPNRPPYRLGPKEQDELQEQLTELLNQGFIQPSQSPYGAPVLFVPKKDGRWRMCVDYRALNKQTIRDNYPLPRIDELLEHLGGAKYFTKLDLASGYHQIAMKTKYIHKIAFRTSQGHYEFIVMPFGLNNAPATFQRLMNSIFSQEWGKFICVYLDDILVFLETLEEHLKHIQISLQRLRESKLYGRIHKCEFIQPKVEYLGFEVTKEGLKPSPAKIQAVAEWPVPKTVKDIRSFLGLASYYRRFIKDFSQIAKPLTELTKEKVTWRWEKEEEKAFLQLKVALTTAPILRLPNFDLQFTLTTDASDNALGAILEQDFGNGLQPIAYASRKLNATEARYSAYERELLGLVWAIGQWRQYLDGRRFVARTDHSSLRHLPNQNSVNRRIWKWVGILQGYDIDIQHIPGARNPTDSFTRSDWLGTGKFNKNVKNEDSELVKFLRVHPNATDKDVQNALSKLFKKEIDCISAGIRLGEKTEKNALLLVSRSSIGLDQELKIRIIEKQNVEQPWARIREEMIENEMRYYNENKRKYKLENNILYIGKKDRNTEDVKYWRMIIPEDQEIRKQILTEIHSVPYQGHPGYNKTMDVINRFFYWEGISLDVRNFVISCPICQMEKADHQRPLGELQPIKIPEDKWSDVMIDFITKLPRTKRGHDSVLTVVDRATKFCHFIPCTESISAKETADLFWNKIVSLHGMPRAIHSDRDVRFQSQFWKELWRISGTKLKFSTAYHPQTQGLVEKMNQVVEQVIRCSLDQEKRIKDWDLVLPTIEFVVNSSVNKSIGYSPFFLMHGYHPVSPVELIRDREDSKLENVNEFLNRMNDTWNKAKQNMNQAQERMKTYEDRRRHKMNFEENDKVLLNTQNLRFKNVPAKLRQRYIGPFKIVEKISESAYRLGLPVEWKIHDVFHVSLLKPWRHQVAEVLYSPSFEVEYAELDDACYEDEDKEIEKILRWRKYKKGNTKTREYLVLFKNDSVENATWVLENYFTDEVVRELKNDINEGRLQEAPAIV